MKIHVYIIYIHVYTLHKPWRYICITLTSIYIPFIYHLHASSAIWPIWFDILNKLSIVKQISTLTCATFNSCVQYLIIVSYFSIVDDLNLVCFHTCWKFIFIISSHVLNLLLATHFNLVKLTSQMNYLAARTAPQTHETTIMIHGWREELPTVYSLVTWPTV